MTKDNKIKEMKKRISCIKKFAEEMGYAINEENRDSLFNNYPYYSIKLVGTYDSVGSSFEWAWRLDTYEEL